METRAMPNAATHAATHAATNATLAEAAGLQRAWADHRADVEQAIAVAARLRAGFARPAEPAAEPTPAYHAPEPGK
jgi:hypothetical protein